MSTRPAAIVLVHGAWHGSWCWQRLVLELTARGLASHTIDLPSVGGAGGQNLSSDAAAVRAVLEGLAGPVLLCGHSYGGMVISLAAHASRKVSRLAYLAAFMPLEGQSLVAVLGGQNAPWIRRLENGMTLPDLALAGELFYGDCDAATRAWAIARLRPQRGAAYAEAVPAPAWREIPATYIVCARDATLPPELQRSLFAPRAQAVRELEASHSPFLSQPAALAELLAEAATS